MFSHYFWKLGTNYPLQVVHIIKSIQTQNCQLKKKQINMMSEPFNG